MDKKRRLVMWIVWVIFYPAAIWTGYSLNDFPASISFFDISVLTVLTVVVSLFPIRVLNSNISLITGISLAIFLYYGLFLSLIITQIAVFSLTLKVYFSTNEHYRYLTNTLMFAWISVGSGIIFELLGGHTGPYDLNKGFYLIPIAGYILAHFLLNHLFLYVVRTYAFAQKVRFIEKDLWVDIIFEMLVIPVGVLLYVLYSQIGTPAIFYVGFPFLSLSIIINLYHASQQVNDLLQKSSEIGQQLSEHLQVNDILDVFIDKLTSFILVDGAYIFDAESGEYFKLIRKYEKNEGMIKHNIKLLRTEGVSGKVWATGKSILYSSKKQWRDTSESHFNGHGESIISVPMIRSQKIVGVITFMNQKKKTFQKHHLMIMEILANYLAVAIDNAKNYETTKLKSEQCPLTGLFNYRYFENLLSQMYDEFNYFQREFSVILMDIDHFKKVNDTYGHQSGNEVLIQLARRLEQYIGENGKVARYGGEEFVILLPHTNEMTCYRVAEELRSIISLHPFLIKDDLKDKRHHQIYITASIGISTAPLQGEDPLTLLRNADRAMYTGAKQQGRNKVARYVG